MEQGTKESADPWIIKIGTFAFLTSTAELHSSNPYPAFLLLTKSEICMMGKAGRWYME